MKKLISIIIALLLVSLLIACDTEGTINTSEKGNDTSNLLPESNDAENKNDNPENDEQDTVKEQLFVGKELAELSEASTTEYYATIQAGEYLGEEFQGVQKYNSSYVILETYEELCEKTTRGSDYPEEMLDSHYVVAIYTKSTTRAASSKIGYKNMWLSNGVVVIDKHMWDASYMSTGIIEVEEISYILVPKSTIDKCYMGVREQKEVIEIPGLDEGIKDEVEYYIPKSGSITVNNKNIKLKDSVRVRVEEREYENGTVWLLEPKELAQFLQENGMPNSLDWNKKCDCECEFYYCSTAYKILVFYWESVPSGIVFNGKSTGYGDLYYYDGIAYLSRSYSVSSLNQENSTAFEFIAIYDEELPNGLEGIEKITVQDLCYKTSSYNKRAGISSDTVTVEEREYGYYDMLELGGYLSREEENTGDDSYRIITSYEELLSAVENPFVGEELFSDSYVIALRINGCNADLINGIRDLYFDGSRLCATLEYSDAEMGEGFCYCYIAVPREALDISDKPESGKLSITVNVQKSYQYSSVEYDKDYLALNQVWFVNSYYTAEWFDEYRRASVAVPYYEEGYVLVIYYGKLAKSARLTELSATEGSISISFTQKGMHGEEDARFHIIKLDASMLDAVQGKINMTVTKYIQSRATRIDESGTEQKSYESFYATRGSIYSRLDKIPEFEYKLLDGAGEFLEVLTEHVRILLPSIPEEIDFEGYYVLAFNAVQECEDCASGASFRGARVVNGILYVDVIVDSHTHTNNRFYINALHFVLIPREIISGDVNDVVFIKAS